eukprot:7377921-Prymnesium_polylepis.1
MSGGDGTCCVASVGGCVRERRRKGVGRGAGKGRAAAESRGAVPITVRVESQQHSERALREARGERQGAGQL